LQTQPTHPARPTINEENECCDRTLDWIFVNEFLESVIYLVPKFAEGIVADHYPVYA